VHYRQQAVLKEAGLYQTAKAILHSQIGVPYVRRLVPDGPQDAAAGAESTGEAE